MAPLMNFTLFCFNIFNQILKHSFCCNLFPTISLFNFYANDVSVMAQVV